jgi:hypothetical protein
MIKGILKCFAYTALHCWKKRDFQIIHRKVGGFLTLSVANSEFFIGWKEKNAIQVRLGN